MTAYRQIIKILSSTIHKSSFTRERATMCFRFTLASSDDLTMFIGCVGIEIKSNKPLPREATNRQEEGKVKGKVWIAAAPSICHNSICLNLASSRRHLGTTTHFVPGHGMRRDGRRGRRARRLSCRRIGAVPNPFRRLVLLRARRVSRKVAARQVGPRL